MGAAAAIQRIEQICNGGPRAPDQGPSAPAGSDTSLVCTVGSISVWPDSSNVIPGNVNFTIDIRWASEILGHASSHGMGHAYLHADSVTMFATWKAGGGAPHTPPPSAGHKALDMRMCIFGRGQSRSWHCCSDGHGRWSHVKQLRECMCRMRWSSNNIARSRASVAWGVACACADETPDCMTKSAQTGGIPIDPMHLTQTAYIAGIRIMAELKQIPLNPVPSVPFQSMQQLECC